MGENIRILMPIKSKRRHMRFKPDPGAIAIIVPVSKSAVAVGPITGLVVEEAYGGCCFVAIKTPDLKENSKIRVTVGRLSESLAEVRWTKSIDEKLFYVGIMYLRDATS